MIPFDFDYYRPDTVTEALQIFRQLDSQGREPLYYGGGSEIISMARVNNLRTKAVIDLKAISECNVLELRGNDIVIGSMVTLSRISESKLFPLLGKTGGRIADHTMQCRITLGGNIAGTIIYREAVLPLLLSDCRVIAAVGGALKEMSIHEVFNERLLLPRGAFLVQFIVAGEYAVLPYAHVKKTKNEKIDYPLISLAAVRRGGETRLAASGVCSYPFRSALVEACLNDTRFTYEERAANALGVLPAPVLDDIRGSGGYRSFVLKNTLANILETLEGNPNAQG